jgi:hypothetical protein
LQQRKGIRIWAGDRINFVVDANGDFNSDTLLVHAAVRLHVDAAPLTANDRDPDGDALTVQLVDGPAHGQLVLQPGGAFSYTPAAGFLGTDSFTYRVSDGLHTSAPATVTLLVEPKLVEGDANGDGRVDLNDFGLLKQSFGTSPAFRPQGDLNGDHKVDLTDFGILKENFGQGGSAALAADSAASDSAWQAAVDWALAAHGKEDEAT